MFCPSDVNTGFIELVGPIQQADLNHITVKSSPLSISFAPRTTTPTLMDNRIPESIDNTCTYKGKKFSLVDIQICSTMHKGYMLPGVNDKPAAELIISFSGSADISGILLCVPIYNTGVPQHHTYIGSIVNPTDTTTNKVPTLESIFYAWDGDTTQSSFSYKTCFEVMDSSNHYSTKSLYMVIFPNGIHLAPDVYQQLMQKMNSTLTSYMVPPAIRGADATLRSYSLDDNGNKKPSITSSQGIIYTTHLSTCTEDFKNRFEYFTLPPRLPTTNRYNSEQCPYYKTTQYKCVPFNQLSDLSGAYVVPGNKSLDTILEEQRAQKDITSSVPGDSPLANLSVEQVETIAASLVGGIILIIVAVRIGSWLSNRP